MTEESNACKHSWLPYITKEREHFAYTLVEIAVFYCKYCLEFKKIERWYFD